MKLCWTTVMRPPAFAANCLKRAVIQSRAAPMPRLGSSCEDSVWRVPKLASLRSERSTRRRSISASARLTFLTVAGPNATRAVFVLDLVTPPALPAVSPTATAPSATPTTATAQTLLFMCPPPRGDEARGHNRTYPPLDIHCASRHSRCQNHVHAQRRGLNRVGEARLPARQEAARRG